MSHGVTVTKSLYTAGKSTLKLVEMAKVNNHLEQKEITAATSADGRLRLDVLRFANR